MKQISFYRATVIKFGGLIPQIQLPPTELYHCNLKKEVVEDHRICVSISLYLPVCIGLCLSAPLSLLSICMSVCGPLFHSLTSLLHLFLSLSTHLVRWPTSSFAYVYLCLSLLLVSLLFLINFSNVHILLDN